MNLNNFEKRTGNFSLCNIKRALVLCVVMFCAVGAFGQTTYRWIGTDGAGWAEPANWSPNTGYPVGADDIAVFDTTTSVTLTFPITIGALEYTSDGRLTLTQNGHGFTVENVDTRGELQPHGGGNFTVTNLTGDGSVLSNANPMVLSAGGSVSVVGGVNVHSLSALGTSTISTNITTTGSSQIYVGAVTLRDDISLSGTNHPISFGSTVNGAHNLKIDANSTTFGGAVSVTSVIFIGDDTTITANDNLENVNVFIDLDDETATMTLGSSLSATNLLFYNGTLSLNGNDIRTEEDFAIFGVGYDTTNSAGGRLFSYTEPPSYYPGGGFVAGTAAFAGLGGREITVNGNFYNNGADMIGTARWFLNIPSRGAPVPTPTSANWEVPYAVAVNMEVQNSTARGSASDANQYVETLFNVTDGGGNINWRTSTSDTYTWTGRGVNTNWTTSGNWDQGGFPNSDTHTAIFPSSITTPQVTIDRDITIADLTIENDVNLTMTNDNNFTVEEETEGGGSLAIIGIGSVTFGGEVGGTTALASLNVAVPSLTINGNVTATTQSYGNIVLGADVWLAASQVSVIGAVTGPDWQLRISRTNGTETEADKVTFDGDVGTTSNPLDALWVISNAISIGGNVYTNGTVDDSPSETSQEFSGAITLRGTAANTRIFNSTGAGLVLFGNTVNGAPSIEIIGNSVSFSREVGGVTALAAITVRGTTSISNNIRTTGDQTYYGDITIADDATLTAVNVILPATQAQTLTLSRPLNIIGNLYTHSEGSSTVTIANAARTLTVNGTFTLTRDDTAFNADVDVTGTGTITTNILSSNYDGDTNLNMGRSPLSVETTFWVDGDTDAVATPGSFTIESLSSIAFNGNGIVGGSDTGGAATIVSVTAATLSVGAISIVTPIADHTNNTIYNFTTTGATTIAGNVTAGSLTIDASETNFSRAGEQTITTGEAVEIQGGIRNESNLTFSNGLTHEGATDPITLQGTVSATSGDLSFQGNLRLANGTTLQTDITADTFVRLYGNVNNTAGTGPADNPIFDTPQLIIASSDNHEINIVNDVDNVFEFGGIFTKSDESPESGTTTFTNGFSHTGSRATLVGTIVAGSGGLSFAGTTTLGADTTLTAGTATAGDGNITFTETSTLDAAGHTLTLNAERDTIALGCDITDANTPAFNAATLAFLGRVPNSSVSPAVTAQTINVPANAFSAFTGTVRINNDSARTTTFANGFTQIGGSAVTVNGTVNATSGNLSFNGPVIADSTNPITLNASGIVRFQGHFGAGAAGNDDAPKPSITASVLDFGSHDPQTIRTQELFEHSGSVTFTDETDGSLSTVTFTNGFSQLDGAAVTMEGEVIASDNGLSFTGSVELTRDTTLTASGQDILFANTISGAANLTTTAANEVSFGGRIGSFGGAGVNLTLVDVTAATINLNGGSITTLGSQIYRGNVTLGTGTTLDANGDGDIQITGTVIGNNNSLETKASSNDITFARNISGVTAFTTDSTNIATNINLNGALSATSVNITAGTINLNGSEVTTTGAQRYNGAVRLGSSVANTTRITSSSTGNIEFVTTIDGDDILIITGNTTVSFGGAVGATESLESFNVTASTINLSGGFITTTDDQNYEGDVVLGASTMITTSGVVEFTSTITGNQQLTITGHAASGGSLGNANSVTFGGAVGTSVSPLKAIYIKSTNISIHDVYTNGTINDDSTWPGQTYDGNVSLLDTVVLSSTGGDVVFTGAASGATRNLTVTSSGTISFGAAVSNFNNITADAEVSILFLSSVEASGTLELTAANNTEEDQSLAWAGIQFNGAVTANSLVVHTADVYIGNASAFNITTGIITFPAHLFIMADAASDVVSFNRNVDVRESLVIRGGSVTFTSGVDVADDLAIFGSGLDSADTTPDGEASIWSYTMADSFTAAGAYAGTRAATNVIIPFTLPNGVNRESTLAGSISNLGTATVENNFYINGGSIANGSLKIPSNDSARAAFAEARNTTINNVTVTGGVIAAAPNTTVSGSSANISTSRPEIDDAYTVSDNMIYVRFSEPIENTNDEISAAVGRIKASTNNNYTSEGYVFNGSFTDAAGTTSTDGAGDISEFYLRVSDAGIWNTDATGTSIGAADSTDRSGTHRDETPSIHIPIALTNVYETLRSATKNRIETVNYTGTADEAPPVLAAVYTGQEMHVPFSSQASMPYDAHNFIELRFSEAVDITMPSGDVILDAALNKQVTADFGAITESGVGLEIAGLITINRGELKTGSRDKLGVVIPDDSTVHAYYRNFSIDGTNPPAEQSHRLRISIAGFNEDQLLVTGVNSNFYPGYIDEAETPSGLVNFNLGATSIIGRDGNALDTSDASRPSVNDVLPLSGFYGGWDIAPPVFARVNSADPTSLYETVGISDAAGTRILQFQMHFHDNQPTTPTWVQGAGWTGGTHLDTVGGARPNYTDDTTDGPDAPSTMGGLRASTLLGAEQAFSITSLAGVPAGGFVTDTLLRYISDTTFFVSGTQGLAGVNDTLYLSIEPTEILNPTARYNISYDETKGFITDLAGNRLDAISIETSDLVAPEISLTLAPFVTSGTQQLYVYFNKALALEGQHGFVDLANIHNEIEFVGATGGALSAVTGTEIAFETETATGLVFTLNRVIAPDEIFSISFRPGSSSAGDIGGTNGARMNTSRQSPVTYFGVNTVTPVFAQNTYGIDDEGLSVAEVTIRTFDGSLSLHAERDITMEVFVDKNIPELSGSPVLYLDSNPDPLSYDETYEEETGREITFWMREAVTPSEIFSTRVNDDAIGFPADDPSSGSPYTFTIGVDDIERSTGDTMQFLFQLGSLQTPNEAGIIDVPTPLYHINLPDTDDLANIGMFSFKVIDAIQSGGVTILNNVINTESREEMFLEVILPRAGNLSISVMTLDGNIIKTLSRGQKSAGEHYFRWDGTNNAGNPVTRGVYFVRIVGPGIDETRKVMAVKE